MRRRDLIASGAAAGMATRAWAQEQRDSRPSQVLMKAGCQSSPTSEERLRYFKRFGVEHICGYPDDPEKKGYYSTEDLSKLKERCEKYKISLDMIAPPFLASSHIDRTPRPAIMLGQSPERDRDIEHIQTMIRNCAKVGIPAIKYNMSILGVLRTSDSPGRGGSRYSTWKLAEAKTSSRFKPETRAGRITADIYWERITYFLERVIPVAAEHKIRMACHPHDPGVPPGSGFQGVDAVLGTVDGLKKFVSIKENPYHGINFCQGTVSEMLQDPGREIFDVIRFFGSRKKIFNVHFRNIRGKRDDFMETYPDEGDINFARAIRVYHEVGYQYMLMPDHIPSHTEDPGKLQGFAFAYGYIKALIQNLEAGG